MGVPSRTTRWAHRFRHLRLPFNALLAPLFLWGAVLADATVGGPVGVDPTGAATQAGWRIAVAFVALHVFLYGGTNAFNSYYDRDEGPIGGMLEPPPVDRGLLLFSLAWQGIGAALAPLAGLPFAAAWGLLFLVFTAYSHPAVRLKRNPVLAFAAVGLGQGAVGFACGWLARAPDPAGLLRLDAVLGMVAATAVVAGLYVVTQSYQSDEDARRGDRTLPVLLGPRRALAVATVPLGLGGALLVVRVAAGWGAGWATATGALLAALGAWMLAWSRRFDASDVRGEFVRTMRFLGVASGALAALALALALAPTG